MKKLLIFAIIAVLAFQVADAQRRKTSQDASSSFGEGYAAKQFYIGPTLGYGWGPAIGVDGEYTITDKQWLAFGAGGQMAYHLGYTDVITGATSLILCFLFRFSEHTTCSRIKNSMFLPEQVCHTRTGSLRTPEFGMITVILTARA